MDLIDRQKAIKALCKAGCDSGHCGVSCDDVKAIEDLPSAVVQCKDCKHYQFADNRAFGLPVKRCEWTGFEDVDDDDFCSRGEREDPLHGAMNPPEDDITDGKGEAK